MIRIKADDELLDIDIHSGSRALALAAYVRPGARLVLEVIGGPHELTDDADTTLYTGDKVAHWAHPGETGEIVETEVPRSGPRAHWVTWDDGFEPVGYPAHSLIRVTKLELTMIEYTDPSSVSGFRTTPTPLHRQSVSGYGGAIPTCHMIRYLGTWRRVYMMQYSNSGTPYVNVRGTRAVLDVDTQHTMLES